LVAHQYEARVGRLRGPALVPAAHQGARLRCEAGPYRGGGGGGGGGLGGASPLLDELVPAEDVAGAAGRESKMRDRDTMQYR
jgi:hypothetical protein